MAVLGRGRGGPWPLTFCPGSPVFPPTVYYCPPHSALGGPAPQCVLASTATDEITIQYDSYYKGRWMNLSPDFDSVLCRLVCAVQCSGVQTTFYLPQCFSVTTPWVKKETLYSSPKLCQILTNYYFHKSFSVKFSSTKILVSDRWCFLTLIFHKVMWRRAWGPVGYSVTNLLLSRPMKELRKSVNIWQSWSGWNFSFSWFTVHVNLTNHVLLIAVDNSIWLAWLNSYSSTRSSPSTVYIANMVFCCQM